MAQLSGNTSSIRTSTEELNFQLAQPKPTHSTDPATPEVTSIDAEQEKSYLETEIDSYSGVDFKNRHSFPSSIRRPTQSKPTLFTFGSANPFAVGPDKTTTNDNLYTTVCKQKTRPKVPPKPLLKDIKARARDVKNSSTRLSTTSLINNSAVIPGGPISCEDEVIHRVNSLPNLEPLNVQQPGIDVQRHSTIGYGMISRLRSNETTPKPLRMDCSSNTVDYCDMIPESPLYVNELHNDSENVYEDVKLSSPKRSVGPCQSGTAPRFVSDVLYTEMSPISDVNFTFESCGIYENLPALRPSSRVGIFESEGFVKSRDVLETPPQFSSNKTQTLDKAGDKSGYPIIPYSNCPPENYEYRTSGSTCNASSDTSSQRLSELSPSSSFAENDSSIVSTAASSFQGIQVCYFPPQPPPGFYGDVNTSGLPSTDGPARPEPASGSSTATSTLKSRTSSSRQSRSRIPVPVKTPKTPESYSHSQIKVPEEPAPPLPPTPSPSPAPIPKNKKKGNKQDIKLSPPLPLAVKNSRWYEKLGCIQSDTIHTAEPYGEPGERKRSKSLSKEHRRSKFFIPVEPRDAPRVTSDSSNNTERVNYQNIA